MNPELGALVVGASFAGSAWPSEAGIAVCADHARPRRQASLGTQLEDVMVERAETKAPVNRPLVDFEALLSLFHR